MSEHHREDLQDADESKEHRKQLMLTHHSPSRANPVADAIVIKNEDFFFLCNPDGSIPIGGNHGLGLYYHDCRFLSGYSLELAGVIPQTLAAVTSRGFEAMFELTNAYAVLPSGKPLHEQSFQVKWTRVLDAGEKVLHDVIQLHNYSREAIWVPLHLHFRALFEDVFNVRGLCGRRPGRLHPPEWRNQALFFLYAGADGLFRSLSVHFWINPKEKSEQGAAYEISLRSEESKALYVSLVIAESPDDHAVQPAAQPWGELSHVRSRLSDLNRNWLEKNTSMESDLDSLNRALERSFLDHHMLRSSLHGCAFYSAGTPWFATLFGRDSLLAALETLAFDFNIARSTLLLVSKYQGSKDTPWTDEQPGKILHELRVGELTNLGLIPYHPYYGSVDSTLLFLILLCEYTDWSGKLDLMAELHDSVEAALRWLDEYGDKRGTDFISYESAAKGGLVNQGWKDSGNAIVNEDGSLGEPPIALPEVQGYCYLAKIRLAAVFEEMGKRERAQQLRRDAKQLKKRFNRDFWMPEKQFYALALQKGGRPAKVISSNPGQALWTGIVDKEKTGQVVDRLFQDDMYSGWGIRTLSARERRYNPIGYHLGTVWPHDNAIIAAGLRHCGYDEQALQVFDGIFNAATFFQNSRLPELFSGFSRREYSAPVAYPVACHPQAWSSGALPFMIVALLGLRADAMRHRLRIVRPLLPHGVNILSLKGLRVGTGNLDLEFRRVDGQVAVRLLRKEGDVDVVIDTNS